MDLLVIGGGIEGLTLAELAARNDERFLVVEKENEPGGLVRSFEQDGFYFDCAGHLLHTTNQNLVDYLDKNLTVPLVRIQRQARIYSQGVFTQYPFQTNLYGLPEEVIRECRAGLEKVQGIPIDDSCFENWCLTVFGDGIAERFMIPYNTKLYRTPLKELTCDWVNRFIPKPTLEEFDRGAREPRVSEAGYNSFFYYPAKGGIHALVHMLTDKFPAGSIVTGTRVERLDIEDRCAILSDGREVRYTKAVSTIPLPELGTLVSDQFPREFRDAIDRLRWVGVYCQNIGFEGPSLDPAQWVYFPEETPAFYRCGSYHNILPQLTPDGCISFYVEYSYDPDNPGRFPSPEQTVEELKSVGLIDDRHRLRSVYPVDIPYAYVVFNHNRAAALKTIFGFLRPMGVYPAGRYGRWIYSSVGDALMKLATRDKT